MTVHVEDYAVVESRLLLDHPRVRLIADTLERDGRRRPYLYLESPS